jgi:hypothetical protein
MFSSIESICEEFGLQKNLSKGKLRAELKKRIVSIHSDKTGGDFPNEAVKQLYLRMQEAVEFLDGPTKVNALEKRNPAASALEATAVAQEVPSYLRGPSYEESVQRTTDSAGRRYRNGWISSGAFAAVCCAILSFSKKLSESPLFSPIPGVFWVRVLISVVFVMSGLGFVAMRIKELKLKRKISAILSEDGITWTVRKCINRYTDEPDCAITQRKMMDAVCGCGKKSHKSKAVMWMLERFATEVPRDLAEKVVKLQISSLVERGAVRRGGMRGIEPVYVLETSLAKEIVEDYDAMMFENELP